MFSYGRVKSKSQNAAQLPPREDRLVEDDPSKPLLSHRICLDPEYFFTVPVDGEHKSRVFQPFSCSGVHIIAFHASWLSFFASFLATFAPAALLPVIRDDLNLTDRKIGDAGVASVAGAVLARILLGILCDCIGPRFGHSILMLLNVPAVLAICCITGPVGFILVRFVVGLSLATFVACQFWSSVMFNVRIVGVANAAGAGFGSCGGGLTLLIMPLLQTILEAHVSTFLAWRLSMFFPAMLCLLVGLLILTSTQDLPDGNYALLKKKGKFSSQGKIGFLVAMRNYRTWLLAIVYGFTFGFELTMNNILTSYYYDNFGIPLKTAGMLAFMYGFMNVIARPSAGFASDFLAKAYGIRARLWILWSLHFIGGLLCILLGFLSKNLVGTILVVVVMAFSVEASEAAAFAVVPFVSKRALGVVAGLVGAGGNAGAIIIQGLFFNRGLPIELGMKLTGIVILLATLCVPLIYFPMWGGMFTSARADATEEEYYLAEYSTEEITKGLAALSLKFAAESRSQRGSRKFGRVDKVTARLTDSM